jgi:hypothetical protein
MSGTLTRMAATKETRQREELPMIHSKTIAWMFTVALQTAAFRSFGCGARNLSRQ